MEYQEVKDYYEKVYQSESGHAFPFDHQRYLAWIRQVTPAPQKGARSLDIGCGVGYVCSWLKKEGYEVYGNDISERALEEATRLVPEGHFSRSDESGKVSFEDENLDLVTCLGVLEHIKPQQTVINESYRVLKPGGRAVFIVPNSINPYFWLGGTGQILEVPHTLGVWRSMFEKAGFRIQKVGKDPGPSSHANDSLARKTKLTLQSMINLLPVHLTYQFIFIMRKDA